MSNLTQKKKKKVNKASALKKKIELMFNKIINSLSKRKKLRVIYNSPDTSGFTPQDYQLELDLYNRYKTESNSDKFTLLSLPPDNPLIQIIDGKRLRSLDEWNSWRIPVGGGLKSDKQIIKEFINLKFMDWEKVLVEDSDHNWNVLRDYSNQDSGLTQIFPEMLDVPTTSGSVLDCLRDKERFLKAYENKIFKDGFHMLDKDYRNFYRTFIQMVRRGSGSHPVVNFPSQVARFIVMEAYYEYVKKYKEIPGDNFVIMDPSAGWGGRLLGALCAFDDMRKDYKHRTGRKLHVTYLTTDPNSAVHDRFKLIVNDWFDLYQSKDSKQYFHFNKETLGSETPEFLQFCKDVLKELDVPGVNVALTSPPYFCQEQYSTDPAQSYIMYPTYERWVKGFLERMISNVHSLLQPGCKFYLNIADTNKLNKQNHLEANSVRIMTDLGMKEVVTYKMILAGKPPKNCKNMVKENDKLKKFEPVFVFQKPDNSSNQ